MGGAIANSANSVLTITGSNITKNQAGNNGGGIYNDATITTLDQSCIVDNSDFALIHVNAAILDADNNWWGAPDGPSGVAPGSGDSLFDNVDYSPFLTGAPAACASRTAAVAFSKSATPSGNLLPGQPLTFTLTITNESDVSVKNIYVSELLPANFTLKAAIPSRAGFTLNGSGFIVSQLEPFEVVTVILQGVITSTLNTNTVLVNTAILSSTLIAPINRQATANVVVPTINWSQENYVVDEDNGSFTANLLLAPSNPYTTVSVQVVYTDSAAGALSTAAVVNVVFPPNSSSQPVTIPLVDDNVLGSRTILLGLQAPNGAALGPNKNATITLVEDDAQAALIVDKGANVAQARTGDTITYTYRITNTGNVTLSTISAVDNKLGGVAGLAGALPPNGTRNATLSYVVQQGDLPGPLVNTVVVTATGLFNTSVTATDSASITISGPTALPENEQPQQPWLELYLPRVRP